MTPDFLLDGDPKFGNFIWLQLILGQKSCCLGPIQLARRKINIHYYEYAPLTYSLCEQDVLDAFTDVYDMMYAIRDDHAKQIRELKANQGVEYLFFFLHSFPQNKWKILGLRNMKEKLENLVFLLLKTRETYTAN